MTESLVPRGMTPEKLRAVAGWLDLYDLMAEKYFEILHKSGQLDADELAEVLKICTGKQVQKDLRQWAEELLTPRKPTQVATHPDRDGDAESNPDS